MTAVLFVCTGNICRSPTAEGVLRARAEASGRSAPETLRIDSAGTTAYHEGEPPDPRAAAAALARGYDLSGITARQITPADFDQFDLLLAMDRSHLQALRRACPPHLLDRVHLFMRYATRHPQDSGVPDPYYGGPQGFEAVLDMIEDACDGLLAQLPKAR